MTRINRSKKVSIQLISPASGEPHCLQFSELLRNVSIQLISPASGELRKIIRITSSWLKCSMLVSIQLISPASGEFTLYINESLLELPVVSIQLISPASGETQMHRFHPTLKLCSNSFHSINFPSEWGVMVLIACKLHQTKMFPFN